MDNVITIKFKETQTGAHDYGIDFESNPTVSELCASILVLQEVLEHNFDRQTILNKMAVIYSRLQDIEEFKRGYEK